MASTGRQYWREGHSERSIGRACLRLLLCCACSGAAFAAHAETPAGDRVINTAALAYDINGVAEGTRSNTDLIVVAERLDVALTRIGSGPITPATAAIAVLLVNRGNGMEAFRLSASDATATPPTRFAIDTDGNGRYDADRDTLLADATTPLLAPGASLRLLLLGESDGAFDGAVVTIAAQAVTGAGNPGTTFERGGDGGGDAVVGPTGARAQVTVPMIGQDTQPTLAKTQSVAASDGSARIIRGSTITYTLVASFPQATTRARIDDPIPAGTLYLPGTLSLDGTVLTDAADSDAGQADASGIGVALGAVAAGSTRTLQFKVRIQ